MFCPKCGREGKMGEVYCGGCGVALPWEEGVKQTDTAAVEETLGRTDDIAAEEAVKRAGIAAEEETATDTAGVIAKESEPTTFVIKRSTIKKALLSVTGFIATVILLVCCIGNSEIRDVKNGVLEDYNYGISIGDALHGWFGGTEKWSSFSEDGVVYVMARGTRFWNS